MIIRTKYLGPTNSRGSRFKATSSSGESATVSDDYSLNSDKNHLRAALALCKKLNWKGCLQQYADNNGYVFVFDGKCISYVIASDANYELA